MIEHEFPILKIHYNGSWFKTISRVDKNREISIEDCETNYHICDILKTCAGIQAFEGAEEAEGGTG